LVETGTHIVTAAEIGPYKRSEQDMAKALIDTGKLKKGMLLLADRGFYGYDLWKKADSTGAKLAWRIKSNLQIPIERILADGLYLSSVCDSKNKSTYTP
jgi:hypothetical protein